MKYIDAEKLIAEIERLKEETPIGICEYDKGEENGRYEVLNHLLSTITSLQQGQPDIIEHICLCAGIPVPFMDGNQWCILKGDNIQVGVVGFGDTKEDAFINFIKDIPIKQEQPKKSAKNCKDCPHCVDLKAQDGWRFKGCFGGSYKGKWIAEIDECPLKQKQTEKDFIEISLNLTQAAKDAKEVIAQIRKKQ